MKDQNKVRVTPAEMRKVLLSNASELMSAHFSVATSEVCGQKKAAVNQAQICNLLRKAHS